MTTEIIIAVVLTMMGAVLLLVCGALVEVFRQLSDIRERLDLDDRPLPLTLSSADMTAADLALPAAVERLAEAIVVVLSRKCATCLAIAQSFAAGAPETAWFLLQVPTDDLEGSADMLSGCRDRVVVDVDSQISKVAGINVVPSVLTLRWGRVDRAQAVSSVRQVMSLIPTVRPLGRGLPDVPDNQISEVAYAHDRNTR